MTQRHIPEEQQPLAESCGNSKTRNLQLTILPGNLTEVTTPLLGNSEHGCYKTHIGRGVIRCESEEPGDALTVTSAARAVC